MRVPRPIGTIGGATLVASALLLGGYAALAGGGITLAPTLLIAAYCVAIPAAILRFPGRRD